VQVLLVSPPSLTLTSALQILLEHGAIPDYDMLLVAAAKGHNQVGVGIENAWIMRI
jgi:hypothetical protein